MQSEEINLLTAALIKAQGKFPVIRKANTADIPTKSGGTFSYSYADIGDINDAVNPVLRECGLVVSQAPSIAPDGSPALTTRLLHESGQFISEQMSLQTEGGGAQAQGSGITYARRYAKAAILDLVIEGDDDGRAAQGGKKPNAAVDPETGEVDPRVDAIMQAAVMGGNSFVSDLANKYNQYGKLSEKQLDSGFNAASKILGGERQFTQRAVPNEPPAFEYADEADRF